MGKELARRETEVDFWNGYSDEEKEIIKQTVAFNIKLSDAEWKLFGYICKKADLNPFLKQIYVVKKSIGGVLKMVVMIGIDGYRSIAERTGRFGGVSEYTFDKGLTQYEMIEKYGKEKDNVDKREADEKRDRFSPPNIIPRTATCSVYKVVHNVKIETTATVRWSEYYPTNKNNRFMWNKMPFNQLGKCAEAKAHRKAFPGLFGELYIPEELGVDVTEYTEETVDLQNEAATLYSELQFNRAAIIDFNVGHCSKGNLADMNRYELESLVDRLKQKVKETFENGDEKTDAVMVEDS